MILRSSVHLKLERTSRVNTSRWKTVPIFALFVLAAIEPSEASASKAWFRCDAVTGADRMISLPLDPLGHLQGAVEAGIGGE
jgi:hypothetical protein